jgi:hypothetical protein
VLTLGSTDLPVSCGNNAGVIACIGSAPEPTGDGINGDGGEMGGMNVRDEGVGGGIEAMLKYPPDGRAAAVTP